jgi:hypothetical protein
MTTLQNDTLKLRVRVKNITTKDGRSFDAFETVGKNGLKINVKFRKEVKNLPTEDSYIIVPLEKMNYAKNTIYPTIWVQEVINITPLNTEKQVDKTLLEILDIDTDDLPF